MRIDTRHSKALLSRLQRSSVKMKNRFLIQLTLLLLLLLLLPSLRNLSKEKKGTIARFVIAAAAVATWIYDRAGVSRLLLRTNNNNNNNNGVCVCVMTSRDNEVCVWEEDVTC